MQIFSKRMLQAAWRAETTQVRNGGLDKTADWLESRWLESRHEDL
jgi:hypothetical protein